VISCDRCQIESCLPGDAIAAFCARFLESPSFVLYSEWR
jgi:hypothetical protein